MPKIACQGREVKHFKACYSRLVLSKFCMHLLFQLRFSCPGGCSVGGVKERGVACSGGSLSPIQWREDQLDGQRNTSGGRLGKLELFRLGREGSEGMYSLPQLMLHSRQNQALFRG